MERKWWKEGIVYQIYPRSFNDSDGDGIGDLRGIIQKLDYIKSLGVDIIWLCPVYQSPNDDNGYDISDYRNIMDEFGNMQEFDELLAGIKARGMRLLMDLVANHTSDEHEWFLESKSSVDNPKRDYYIWRQGDNGTPPNNWKSIFGGDAWLKDETTGEYFLHLFTTKQPDLNWENPNVRNEIYDIMKFWLDKGIDGFRMDVISFISKRNYDDTPYDELNVSINKTYANGPKIHDYLQEMNKEVMANYDMMTVGEGPGIDLTTARDYVGEERNELNMVFHFGHMFIDHGPGGKFDPVPYSLPEFKKVFSDWDKCLRGNGWSSIFLGNHDFPRIVSRFGNDGQYWKESAKLLATMLCSLRGTTYVYQGDEFGMTNVEYESFDDFDDVEIRNLRKALEANGEDLQKFIPIVNKQGRDNARTPIQWDDSENAGFTTGTPWLKINPNYSDINAASQENDPDSILNFYREMIQIRKQNLTLVYGDYQDLDPENNEVYAYRRWDDDNEYFVFHNFSEIEVQFPTDVSDYNLVVINYGSPEISNGAIKLNPWQSLIIKTK
ncbi:MAG: alpha-glucosidase [bacterium]|nr:alpha-glucosidase [bacterium]